MMLRCFSSLGCPKLSVVDLCRLAHSFRIPFVELRSLEGKGDYVSWLATHPEELSFTATTFRVHAIKVAGVGSSFNLTNHTESDLADLLGACRVADALQAPYVRIFGGGAAGEKMSNDLIRQAATLYLSAVRFCTEAGANARLIVETHGGLVDSETIHRFCDQVGHKVPLLWDTHHTWKLGGEPLAKTWSEIGPQVRHLHVKDSRSLPGNGINYRYELPGKGEFPFQELFQILNMDAAPKDWRPPDGKFECCPDVLEGANRATRGGPTNVGNGVERSGNPLAPNVRTCPTMSLEWERQWHPELPPIEEALRSWVAVLERMR